MITYFSFFIYFFSVHTHRFMEKRKPYDLKGLLAVYNLAQVVACCYLITGILSKEFKIIKFWKCHSVDYTTNDKSIDILTYSYHTFLLKLLELIETVFFVLRKKQNQVSKLHVYHHASTAILGYIMVKYTGGKCYHMKKKRKQKTNVNVLIMNNLIRLQICFFFSFFFRWYDSLFSCIEFICTCDYVQLLFCSIIWTKSSTKIGKSQKKYYNYSNGKLTSNTL